METHSRFSRWLAAAVLVFSLSSGVAAFGDSVVNDDALDAACYISLSQKAQVLVRRLDRLAKEVTRAERFGETARALTIARQRAQGFAKIAQASCDRPQIVANFETLRMRWRDVRLAYQRGVLRGDTQVQQRFERARQAWQDLRQTVDNL